MSSVIELVWPALTLEHDTATGWTNTRYPDGHTSGCAPVPDDAFHAEALGITPERHRLVHELTHHLVGFAFGYVGSPVIWRDAHGMPQDARLTLGMRQTRSDDFLTLYLTAKIEEWLVTAYTYALYGKPHDAGALMDVRRLCGQEAATSIALRASNALRGTDLSIQKESNGRMLMPE